MNRKISILLLFLISGTQVFAQVAKNDSTDLKTKIAENDAKNFKLDKEIRKKYKKHHFDYHSDYFKPNESTVSNTSLLKDSVYVKAYRRAAYIRNIKRRTAGHYVIVGAEVLIVAYLVFAVIVIGSWAGAFN